VVFECHRTSAPCFGARSGGIGRFDVGRPKQRQRGAARWYCGEFIALMRSGANQHPRVRVRLQPLGFRGAGEDKE